jgi:nitrite reductase/ring-hydroxylating ferredoxin subunit
VSTEPASEGTWHRVANESEFAPGSLRTALVAGLQLCVGRSDMGLFAVSDTCPHAGGSLSEGMVDGREVICPIHAWGFDVETGISPDDPSCVVSVYPVRAQDGAIEILVEG